MFRRAAGRDCRFPVSHGYLVSPNQPMRNREWTTNVVAYPAQRLKNRNNCVTKRSITFLEIYSDLYFDPMVN